MIPTLARTHRAAYQELLRETGLTEHRIGFTAYNLDLVIAGDLDGVLDALTEADRAARIAGEDLERH